MSRGSSFKPGFLISIQTFRTINELEREYVSALASCTWSMMPSTLSREQSTNEHIKIYMTSANVASSPDCKKPNN